MSRIKDLTGQKFGRLTVISFSHVDKHQAARWNCVCVCGRRTVVSSNNLMRGYTKSCGCLEGNNRKPAGEANFTRTYREYIIRAQKRGYSFELDKDTVKILFQSNCFYCGTAPSNKANIPHYNGAFIYNGIDRIDNTKGYITGNVVPCCKTCNWAKSNMPYNEFIQWLDNVAKYRNKQRKKK